MFTQLLPLIVKGSAYGRLLSCGGGSQPAHQPGQGSQKKPRKAKPKPAPKPRKRVVKPKARPKPKRARKPSPPKARPAPKPPPLIAAPHTPPAPVEPPIRTAAQRLHDDAQSVGLDLNTRIGLPRLSTYTHLAKLQRMAFEVDEAGNPIKQHPSVTVTAIKLISAHILSQPIDVTRGKIEPALPPTTNANRSGDGTPRVVLLAPDNGSYAPGHERDDDEFEGSDFDDGPPSIIEAEVVRE